MQQAGATGYVLKTADKATLHSTILSAMRLSVEEKGYGNGPASANIFEDATKPEASRQTQAVPPSLTDREIEILQLLAQGYSTLQMATKLSISPKTVETHRKNMLKKVKVKNIMGLLNYGIQHGIIKIKS
jgi:DNA-binding NarL/FixJ family response regulator